jgi:hypothetical protein
MNTDYKFTTHQIFNKTSTSQRYEVDGVIVRYQDASFAGTSRDIVELVNIDLDAESLEDAHAVAIATFEKMIPALNNPEYGLEYFYRLQVTTD